MLTKTLILLIIALQVSCFQANTSESSQNNNKVIEDLKKTCPTISSETAVLIAQGYMFLDYDLRNREPKVKTEAELFKNYGEMWEVTFVSKSEKSFGDPIVWVLKANGEVFTVKHAK